MLGLDNFNNLQKKIYPLLQTSIFYLIFSRFMHSDQKSSPVKAYDNKQTFPEEKICCAVGLNPLPLNLTFRCFTNIYSETGV